jgi:hypothetical protein
MSNEIPEIKPIKLKEFETKQPKYSMIGSLPTRQVICSPSGGGKTVLLTNLILDIYRNCFSRIYIFSPSVNVDYTWQPVKDYIEKDLKLKETPEDTFYFDHYNEHALQNIILTQHKIITYMKSKGHTKLYQILIIIDDFADEPAFTRQSKLLHQLYIRGRHNMISTITSTQKFNALHPIIRCNMTELIIFRLRNFKDIEAFIEETSAIYDKKTLLEIYHMATAEPYSFLYVKLNAKSASDMFYINFNKRIEINN